LESEIVVKRALLILFGGRSMPNVLTILHEKPDLIIPMISQSVLNTVPFLESSTAKLFEGTGLGYELDTSYVVKPFDVEDVKAKCIKAVTDHPNFDWVFNITSATTLMSIGAYEAAKELRIRGESIRCWYLNTAQTTVVPVLGEGQDDKLFQIEVEQYAAAYDCRFIPGSLEERRQDSEQKWLLLAQMIGKNPQYIDLLKIVINTVGNNKPSKKTGPKQYFVTSSSDMCTLLNKAASIELLSNLNIEGSMISFWLSHLQFAFLDGAWLEAYVWDEARKLGIFSDCRWNQKIVDGKHFTEKNRDSRNEIDVALIYKAQLLIVECKTGERDGLTAETLDWITGVATPLGGRFVSKILVSSLPMPNENDRSFELFKAKAESRSVYLATRVDLPNMGKVLEEQAKTPKYPRI
jgi:hypothetical protein